MQSYSVNVRAVVRATAANSSIPCHVEGWDIYDFQAPQNGSLGHVIRCHKSVYVEAEDENSAANLAMDEVTGIVLPRGRTVEGEIKSGSIRPSTSVWRQRLP
jgi:hypothetical protein